MWDDRLLWGARVVIPQAGRQQALKLFHDGLPGIFKGEFLSDPTSGGMEWMLTSGGMEGMLT